MTAVCLVGHAKLGRAGAGHCQRSARRSHCRLLGGCTPTMACCCVVTSTGTVKMIEKCGKFDHIAKPGLQFLIPCVQAVSGTISMRLQQMEVSCETKSKDNVFLTMRVSIQYQVIDDDNKIVDAHYRLTNPRVQVSADCPF